MGNDTPRSFASDFAGQVAKLSAGATQGFAPPRKAGLCCATQIALISQILLDTKNLSFLSAYYTLLYCG
jgi:hypothetical protein